MNTLERFERRKKILNECRNNQSSVVVNIDLDKISNEADTERISKIHADLDNFYSFEPDMSVSDQEVNNLLEEVKVNFHEENFNNLMSECKDKVISSILVPFGLGKIVSQGDKDGGNVTTTNNFEKGTVATKADGKKYDEWLNNVSHFDRKPYEQDFPDKRKNIFQSSDKVTDGYTGKELPKDGRTHLDHITSANEIDTDPRANLFQAKDKRVAMANSDKNLTMTDSSLNMSKKDSDLNTWANKPSSDDPSKTNREKYGIDKKLMKEKYEQSKSHISKTLAYDQFKKQAPEVLITGTSEAAKMGLQQSVGILLSEFFSSVFDEVKDVYKNSFRADFKVEGFFAILGARLKRIAEKVTSKWKDVLTAFKDGAISGFLSNLATTIINMFVTTAKRVVRMIREGFFSLLKAIKMLIFPPKGMTFKQAAHEATKLIGAGLAITGGILLEEVVEKWISAMLPGMGLLVGTIVAIIVGAVTGIATTLTVYAIDKIDLFGVKAEEKAKFVMNTLSDRFESSFANCEKLIEEIL